MRNALAVAALAAGALAVPYKQRDVVNVVDMVYVTDVVTVTAGQPVPTAVADAKAADKWGDHPLPSGVPSALLTTTEAAWTPTTTEAAVAPTTVPETSVVVESSVVAASTPEPTEAAAQPADSSSSSPSSSSSSSSSNGPLGFLPGLGSGSSVTPAPSGYSDLVIYHHNLHRANHSSPDIAWDDDLAASAATIASTCIYAHNQLVAGGGYGQNIAAGVPADNISAVITNLFYNGEEPFYQGLYGLASPSMVQFDSWGHFSQVVWAASTHVGCATQHCSNGLANVGGDVDPYFTVCNYKNPGNFGGQYGNNIGKPLGHPTANWNTGM